MTVMIMSEGSMEPSAATTPPSHARHPPADERRGVDHDDAGQALAHGIVIHYLLLCGPVVVLDDLTLEDGQHGIAAPKGKGPHFNEGPKDFQVFFHLLSSSAYDVYFATRASHSALSAPWVRMYTFIFGSVPEGLTIKDVPSSSSK